MWAATYGQDDIVKLLLRRGAGVNYTDQKRNAVTALMQAAEQVIVSWCVVSGPVQTSNFLCAESNAN